MTITGPRPLQSENAETTFGRLFFDLQKIIAADLALAEFDDRVDRAVLGAVVATRVLLEVDPKRFDISCHTDDFVEWKAQYLSWFDANSSRLPKKWRQGGMRRYAEAEFDRIIELSSANVYRFSECLTMANDNRTALPYRDDNGRIISVPLKSVGDKVILVGHTSRSNKRKAASSGTTTLNIKSSIDRLRTNQYGLSIASCDETTCHFFNERGLAGDGCTWHAVVESLMRRSLPELLSKVQFGAEAGDLLITSRSRRALERILEKIEEAIKCKELMVEAIASANPKTLE